MLETALPSASTMEKWVVWVDSLTGAGLGWRGHEAGGTDEVFAGRGFGGVDGGAPGCGVLRVGHLLERELVEVGVAEVVAAVHVGAAEGFGDDVDLGGAAVGA